ncbi:MAG: Ribonuclease P protein component, partial [uncultured Solirubrobacterales bacterium]
GRHGPASRRPASEALAQRRLRPGVQGGALVRYAPPGPSRLSEAGGRDPGQRGAAAARGICRAPRGRRGGAQSRQAHAPRGLSGGGALASSRSRLRARGSLRGRGARSVRRRAGVRAIAAGARGQGRAVAV